MYSFIYTSKNQSATKDNYLLHILFEDQIIESLFVQFPIESTQETLDALANARIDAAEGLEPVIEGIE
jgi:hypothetical protein